MRTIKFRGKDIETGKWVYGFYVRLEDTFRKPIEGKERITNRIYTGSADSCVDLATEYNFSGDWYEVDPDTIGHFTGLKDRNGKEIYEGDIIRRIARISLYGNNEASAHVVKFGEDGIYNGFYLEPQCDAFFVSHNSFIFEVIGNIHDNPELLEGGAQ